MLRVSVILLLYRSRSFIESCLVTLEGALQGIEAEAVLVDQGSGDGAAEWATSFLKGRGIPHRVLLPGRNLGVAGGRNAGARAAQGAFMLFLDTDTELRQSLVIQQLLEAAADRPRAAILGPKLVTGAGELYRSARRFPRPIDLVANRLSRMGFPGLAGRARRYHLEDFDFHSPRPVPWMSGACQLMRRQVFLDLGGFDESYFYGLEETDHCLKVWLSGHEVWFVPAGPIHHHTQGLSSRSLRFLLLHVRSAVRFFLRNGRRVRRAEALYDRALGRVLGELGPHP